MKERIIIVVVAVVLGLIITTVGFFIYQSTKVVPDEEVEQTLTSPTPAEDENGILLTIEEPSDESVTDRRSIQIKGKTAPGNTVIVSSNQEDVVGEPTTDGNFSISVTIDAGTNVLTIKAITPTGESTEKKITITFSTEEF